MVTRERKEEICQKYDIFLRIIDQLGHGIMLQKQFIEICILLGAATDNFMVIKALKDLEESEIIKKINFIDTKNKFIILKKYAIKYLTGANSSTEVASIKQPNSNIKFYESIFKMHFIINTVIPTMHRIENINLREVLRALKIFNCNILYTKNMGLNYYAESLIKFTDSYDKEVFATQVEILEEEKKLREDNLNGIKRTVNKPRKKRGDFLAYSTINTLLKKDIYIMQMYKKDNIIYVGVVDFDIQNGKNVPNIALNINIVYGLFKRLFGIGNFKLTYKVVVHTPTAQRIVEKELNKKGINPITHVPRMFPYWQEVLLEDKINGISNVDIANIKLEILNYNIENNYQNGLKRVK